MWDERVVQGVCVCVCVCVWCVCVNGTATPRQHPPSFAPHPYVYPSTLLTLTPHSPKAIAGVGICTYDD